MKKLVKKLLRIILMLTKGAEYIAIHHNPKEARKRGLKVGNNCRFFSMNFDTEPYLISIGDHVTLTDNVHFVTHDGAVWVFRDKEPAIELFGKITVGNNVFIGINSIVLPNTTIGDNSIVAAGSVVKGNFENNSVIAGVPARVISTIDEYYKKNQKRFTHFRNLSPDIKKIKIMDYLKMSE
jgi:acetyltransferase-like isoleucine patch superfamily enzyme